MTARADRRIPALPAFMLLAALFVSSPAAAFVASGRMAQFHTQTYWVNPSFTDIRSGTQAQQIAAVQNGANDWNGAADYLWVYGGQTNVNVVNTGDGVNAVFYVAGSSDAQFGALAICFSQADANNFITGFDVQYFDMSGTVIWDFLYYGQGGVPPATDFDIWSIATHEFGHALGLSHTNLNDNTITMFAQTAPGNITHRGLHADDAAGIAAIYGNGPYTPKFAGVQVGCGGAQNANVGAVTVLAGAWTITNTGNVPDAFNYQIMDGAGWLNPIPPGQTPLLPPGGIFNLAPQPSVNIPPATPNGTLDNVIFTAASNGNPAVQGGCVTQVTAVNPAYVTGAMLGGPPAGLAFDAVNNLYVAVFTTGMVMMVPPGGGPPLPIIAGLANPTGAVLGPNGNLFVADMSGAVYEYTVPAGGLVNIPAPPGTFLQPMDLAFCGADLLVADSGPDNVYVLPGAAAGGPPGPIAPVLYSGPYPDLFGILLDPAGNLLATGGASSIVFKTPPGITAPAPWGNTVGGFAMGIAMDLGGRVYVAEGQIGGDIDVFMPGGGVPAVTIPNSTSGWTWIAFSQNLQPHPPLMNDTFLFTSNTGNVGPPNACAMNVCQFDVAVAVGGMNGLTLPNTSTCPIGPQPAIYAAAPVITGQGPSGLAFEPGGSGHLFVADRNAGVIERILPGGGSSVPVAGGLISPRGLTAAPDLHVAQADGSIAQYSMGGGGFVRYVCPPGTFADPVDMAWCGRDLFVTDRGTATLYLVVNAAGPNPNTPIAYETGFPDLFGVAINPIGQIYVTLGGTPQVARLNGAPGAGWTVVAGQPGALSMQGISFDMSGNYTVADGAKGDIHLFGPGGGLPTATAMNACSGETWIAHGLGVVNPGMNGPEVYYTSNGVGGPANAWRLAVSQLNFMAGPGKRLPDMACGATSGVDSPGDPFGGRISGTELLQNSPNPFHPATRIHYSIEEPTRVRLLIFDMTGRLVRTLVDGQLARGHYAAHWDGADQNGRPAASGIYAYRLEAAGKILTRKMVLGR